MLIPTVLFTVDTVFMAIVLIKVWFAHTPSIHPLCTMTPGSKNNLVEELKRCRECGSSSLRLSWKVHRLYRGGGGSFERAQEEWSTGVWKTATARDPGFNAVSETGPSLPQYPAAVPNYPQSGPWWNHVWTIDGARVPLVVLTWNIAEELRNANILNHCVMC